MFRSQRLCCKENKVEDDLRGCGTMLYIHRKEQNTGGLGGKLQRL